MAGIGHNSREQRIQEIVNAFNEIEAAQAAVENSIRSVEIKTGRWLNGLKKDVKADGDEWGLWAAANIPIHITKREALMFTAKAVDKHGPEVIERAKEWEQTSKYKKPAGDGYRGTADRIRRYLKSLKPRRAKDDTETEEEDGPLTAEEKGRADAEAELMKLDKKTLVRINLENKDYHNAEMTKERTRRKAIEDDNEYQSKTLTERNHKVAQMKEEIARIKEESAQKDRRLARQDKIIAILEAGHAERGIPIPTLPALAAPVDPEPAAPADRVTMPATPKKRRGRPPQKPKLEAAATQTLDPASTVHVLYPIKPVEDADSTGDQEGAA